MRLQKLADWFIPNRVTNNPEAYRRALVLVYILVTQILIMCAFLFTSTFLSDYQNQFYFSIGIPLGIVNLFLYRKTGSNILVGNLTAFYIFLLLLNASLQSGGIFSDDYTWMIIVPLAAFLIANINSGLVWTAIICGYGVYLFTIDKIDPQQFMGKDGMHYLVANIGLFAATGAIVSIFQQQSAIYVKNLKHQRKLLQKQKIQISEQTNQLHLAKTALIKSNKELEQYAYATSHDLKQPLRTVNSFAQLIRKQFQSSNIDTEKCNEYIEFILNGTQNMNSLINDLLEFAKLTATANVEFKTMSLVSIIDSVLQNLHSQIEESDAIINRTSSFPTVDVVPVKINQLFQNIISNSLKFKREDVPLIINIGCVDLGNKYQIYIADNGIGIDEIMFDRIFEPFTRLNSEFEFNGSGIGLATCKRIVDLHNGKIWVDSKKGNGTTFYFTIKKNNNNNGTLIDVQNNQLKEVLQIKKTG